MTDPTPEDFARFAQRLDLELAPWQQQLFEAMLDGRPARFAMPRLPGKRLALDCVAALTIAAGEPVRFVAPTPEAEEAARQRALDLLDRLDRAGEPE